VIFAIVRYNCKTLKILRLKDQSEELVGKSVAYNTNSTQVKVYITGDYCINGAQMYYLSIIFAKI
jgi:hypothetical protein